MIYTVTLNPALDRTVRIKDLQPDDPNRIEQEKKYAGGKGIDVSRVLTHLGVHNRALGFLGGYAGMEIEGLLLEEGIYCDFTPISNETRTNIVLNIEKNRQQILISAPGAAIRPVELTTFFKKIESLHSAEFVVISGSLPPGLSPIIYERAIEVVKNNGGRTVLDTDGENLSMGIHAKPEIIKPNIHELGRLIGKKLNNFNDTLQAAVDIMKTGVEIVLVSLGANGILLVSENEKYLAIPPPVKVVNTIGAGDSAVAGFVAYLSKNFPLADCLKYAAAAGTATVMEAGTAVAKKENIEQLFRNVSIKKV